MSICVEKAISALPFFRTTRDIEWRFLEDAANDCIRIMARTKPVESIRFVKRDGFEVTPCSWTRSWWARLIKWCLKKKYLSRLVPYPLECLACATEISTSIRTIAWPENILSCVMAQAAQIRMEGREPKVVAIGIEKMEELVSGLHFSTFPLIRGDTDMGGQLLGIPLVMTQKITPNSVLVL